MCPELGPPDLQASRAHATQGESQAVSEGHGVLMGCTFALSTSSSGLGGGAEPAGRLLGLIGVPGTSQSHACILQTTVSLIGATVVPMA